MWERWDTIVYPKGIVTDHGVLLRDGDDAAMLESFLAVSGELFLDGIDKRMPNNPEDEELVVARCLNIYLHSYKKKLQSCDIVSTTSGISQMIYSVEQIFNQLQHRLIGHISTSDRTCYSSKEWSSQKLILVCFQYPLYLALYVITMYQIFHKCRLWRVGRRILFILYRQSSINVQTEDVLLDRFLCLPSLFCALCTKLMLLANSLNRIAVQ